MPCPIITGMGELEAAWMMLYDALGIGNLPEPITIAAVLLALFLSILVGTAVGRFALWLPDGIRRFLSSLFEILSGVLSCLVGYARENKGAKQKEDENDTEVQLPKPMIIDWLKEREKEKQETDAEEDETGESDLEEEPEKELPEKRHKQLDQNFYLERELTEAEREELLSQGYKRLKTSAFGDSGASYYLVNKRWNEGTEHAFFCYLIESELRKRGKDAQLFVNNGPDIVFKHKKKDCCIDVETGTNLVRDKEKVARKFEQYARDYFRSYIFVTKKKFKHKYKKYGIVITRPNLRKVLP